MELDKNIVAAFARVRALPAPGRDDRSLRHLAEIDWARILANAATEKVHDHETFTGVIR